MTVSFVGAQGAAAATVTIPAHQVGDLILIFAYRDGSNTAPTTPTAGGTVPTWTLIGSTGGNTNSSNFRYAVATATNTTSGTWTNATELICLVYRGASIGASVGGSGAATTIVNYPALTLGRTNSTSWVVGVAGHRTATNVDLAPSGMTNRAFAGSEAAGHDSNGTRSANWPSTNVTVNASSAFRSWVVELRDPTLTEAAGTGSFTLTGGVATFTVTKKLVADTASFNDTGNDAGLIKSSQLIADRGQFTLTGHDAGLHYVIDYDINVDTGAFSLTGNNVTLTVNRPFDVDTGAFNFAGSDAGLIKTSQLLADRGLYSLTGNIADLEVARLLTADTQSYTLTGHNVDLHITVGYDINVDPGFFTLGGGNVGLFLGVNIDTGSFALTGSTVNFTKDIAMFAASGSFTLTGNAIGLFADRLLVTDTESFTVDGNAVDFYRQLEFLVDDGSFSLSGSAINFKQDYVIPAVKRSYNLTGTTTQLTAARLITVSTGSFALTGQAITFKRAYNFPISPDPFTVAGGGITTRKDYSTLAPTASYALTGINTPLKAALISNVSTGAFTLTGYTVNVQRVLSCLTGTFTLTGIPIDIQTTGDVNSFGSYEPNYVGLIEALIDLKLTFENVAIVPVPDIGFPAEAFENVYQGDILYLRNSDGKVGRAVANSTLEKATVAGVAQTTKLAGETVRVLTLGKTASLGLSPGLNYFLSAASPGSITATPTTTAGYYVVPVGEACSNGELMIEIKPPVLLS